VEPSLKEMSGALVPAIEPVGVGAVHPLHAAGEVRLRHLDDRMKVVGHEHVSADGPAEVSGCLAEEGEEGSPIMIVAEDRSAFVAARGDVVESSSEFIA
jgi:hypothetical protein